MSTIDADRNAYSEYAGLLITHLIGPLNTIFLIISGISAFAGAGDFSADDTLAGKLLIGLCVLGIIGSVTTLLTRKWGTVLFVVSQLLMILAWPLFGGLEPVDADSDSYWFWIVSYVIYGIFVIAVLSHILLKPVFDTYAR